MILIRLTTPLARRLGTLAVWRSTPSTRQRTTMCLACGSKWMSEARSSIARTITELTKRTIGAWSTPSSRSETPVPTSSPPSSPRSSTTSSTREDWRRAAAISSGIARTGRTSWRVIIRRSSSASTLCGSDMATTSVPSGSRRTGMAE